jgi:hypothetical protein
MQVTEGGGESDVEERIAGGGAWEIELENVPTDDGAASGLRVCGVGERGGRGCGDGYGGELDHVATIHGDSLRQSGPMPPRGELALAGMLPNVTS